MNFKVEFWDDERSQLDYRWFDSIENTMFYVGHLRKLDDISSITVSQVLYEFEK